MWENNEKSKNYIDLCGYRKSTTHRIRAEKHVRAVWNEYEKTVII